MMSRRSFACLAVPALAVTVLLVAADPSSAQFLRRGRGSSGYSQGYSQENSGWYAPEYRGFGSDYNSWGVPSYYGEGTGGSFYGPFTGTTFGSYGAYSGGMENNALINVRVPPNAEVFFDDARTSQIGSFRSFISPPLDSDRNFVYHIKARWTEDGHQVEKVRNIEVHPGDRLLVNFIRPRTFSGQFLTEPETRSGERSFERRDSNQEDRNRN
jgi:uncharacterized protein (TIGR03000 family)